MYLRNCRKDSFFYHPKYSSRLENVNLVHLAEKYLAVLD